jgi:hypothetical protein
MGALLESGKVGNVSLNHLKAVRTDVINRWDSLGLLEGLNGHRKENIAQLYENQASYMLNESTALGVEGSFETVVFPIVRRVFSKLLANEIVSVQALNLPIGKLFYFVPKIGKSAFGGDSSATSNDPRNQLGMTEAFDSNVNTYDAFYGEDGMFDKSKGESTTTTVTPTATGYTFDPTSDSGFAITTATTIAAGATAILKVTLSNTGNAENAEEFLSTLKVYTSSALSTSLDFYFPAQKYGNQLMNSAGETYIAVHNSTGGSLTMGNLRATYKTYESLELSDSMGEVSFELKSVTVSVIERKLRAQWSPELAQDVSAFHNIDAEAELTALLSEQVAAEIDREILRDLRRGAAWRMSWDYAGTRVAPFGGSGTGIAVGTGSFYTQKEWNQTLVSAINQVSAQIHKATLRGGANFIVCSAEVSAIFDDLEYFHVSNAAPDQDKYNMGIERVGSLAGRYQVYRDPYFPADTILMGHKGTSLLDTGYIYAPYVPMQLTPTMYNPFTFAPVKGIMTRYAKKMVNNKFYGVIKCKNIVQFGIEGFR